MGGGGVGLKLVRSAVRNKIQSYWGRTVNYWLNILFTLSVKLLLQLELVRPIKGLRTVNWLNIPFLMELTTVVFFINFLHWYQSLFVFYWIVFRETDFTPKWVVFPCCHDCCTTFCTRSRILTWYSNQNKLALVWLVMVWNLVLVTL